MIYGLSGASGTGKTTLGETVSGMTGIPFTPTEITKMAKEQCGFDAIGNLSLQDRLQLQEKMLELYILRLREAKGHLLTDRTPIDMCAYMLAEVYMNCEEELTQDECERINRYVDLCQKATARFFDHVFVVRPLPTYTEASNRPRLNPGYQRHIQLIVEGALMNSTHSIPFSTLISTEREARSEYVADYIVNRIAQVDHERSTSLKLH